MEHVARLACHFVQPDFGVQLKHAHLALTNGP